MKFTVIFKCEGDYDNVAQKEQVKGLDLVDLLRNHFNLPNYPVERIHYVCSRYVDKVNLEISEELARKSGLFATKETADVTVPEEFLNKFYEIVPTCEKEETGEITYMRGVWCVKEDDLLQAWAEAGFPEEWGVE